MNENRPSSGAPRARILVGVDGSSDGLRAVRYAMGEAVAKDADLWVVNVVDFAAPIYGLWDLVSSQELLNQLGRAKVDEAVKQLADEGFPSDRVTGEVKVGSPGETLADLSGKSELLVVGRRARGGLERLFVGSTSVWVAVHAKCPVIVISAASTPHETGGRRVVAIGVSTWPMHTEALEWAMQEAASREARLQVVHVVPETLGLEGPTFVAAATKGLEEQLAQARADHPGIHVDLQVMLGDPVAALVTASADVDLLILGIHRERAVLGGSIRALVAHSHCPVALIKSLEPAMPRGARQ